jgi:hypothetical protein
MLLASCAKSLPASNLEQLGQGRCTHCCTRVELESDLTDLVAVWPSLSVQQRGALAVIVRAMRLVDGSSD